MTKCATPRRDGPGPYRKVDMPKGLNKAEQQAFIDSYQIPPGYNRKSRRFYAWQQRTVKGRAMLKAQSIEAVRP